MRQRYFYDCGVALAASIADVSYDFAFAVCEAEARRNPRDGLLPKHMLVLLHALRAPHVNREPGGIPEGPLLGATAAEPDERIVVVAPKRARYGHWIAVRGGMIYDPTYGRIASIRLSRFRDWRVEAVLRPVPRIPTDAAA